MLDPDVQYGIYRSNGFSREVSISAFITFVTPIPVSVVKCVQYDLQLRVRCVRNKYDVMLSRWLNVRKLPQE
jgi:hypothetical protein